MAGGLLERESEVTAIVTAARTARDGAGRLLLIEGPAGIGKTALLESAAEFDMGLAALRGRCGELERSLPFGLVRQLFERPAVHDPGLLQGAAALAAPALSADPAGATGELFALLHGLYWLCSNLADGRPLLVTVDDLQWCDESSLRFLHYLARRLSDIPLLLLATIRSDEPDAPIALLDQLRHEAAVVLRPQPLSLAATGELLGGAAQTTIEAVHEATGGNPFLVSQLALAVADRESVERAPPSVSERQQLKLNTLGGDARALAEAVAVMGAEAQLRHASHVAGLNETSAVAAADALTGAGVFAKGLPLRFIHPLIRTAVHDAIPAGRRSGLHRAAAHMLDGDPESVDLVATQLLETAPAADPWAVNRLKRAAMNSLARGAPGAAARYAARALTEPPAPRARFDVLSALGQAEVRIGRADGITHLSEAITLTDDVERQVLLARDAAIGLFNGGQNSQACMILREELDRPDLPEGDLRLWLEGDLFAYALWNAELAADARDRIAALAPELTGATAAERNILATFSLLQPTCQDAARIAEIALAHPDDLAEAVVSSDKPIPPRRVFGAGNAAIALGYAQRLEEAETHLDQWMRLRERHANLGALAINLMLRSVLGWLRGAVPAWEDDARRSIETSLLAGTHFALPLAVGLATLAMTERGALADAQQQLERFGFAGALPMDPGFLALRWVRARLNLARGDLERALVELQAVVDADPGPMRGKTVHMLADLSTALAAHGERERARQMAAQAIVDAELWGTSFFYGVALRAKGIAEGGEPGIRTLGEAVDALADSPGRLEHARALVDLGAMQRRANRRSEARGPLREGMDLAVRCGADALVERARQELLATGARPRHLVLTGMDSLTPTELRVAKLAAEGLGNREIAQTLFVSHRTVEMHLSRAYRKLDIASRDQLIAALRKG